MINHYEVLGVAPTADYESIRRAYRRKSREAHPDAGGTSEQFNAVQRAYEVLNDHQARTAFDATLNVGLGAQGPAPVSQPDPAPEPEAATPPSWGTTDEVPSPASTPAPARHNPEVRWRYLGGVLALAGVAVSYLMLDGSPAGYIWWFVVLSILLFPVLFHVGSRRRSSRKSLVVMIGVLIITFMWTYDDMFNIVAGLPRGAAIDPSVFAVPTLALCMLLFAELTGGARRRAFEPRMLRQGAANWERMNQAVRENRAMVFWVHSAHRPRRKGMPMHVVLYEPISGRTAGADLWYDGASPRQWIVLNDADRVLARASDYDRQAWIHLWHGGPKPKHDDSV